MSPVHDHERVQAAFEAVYQGSAGSYYDFDTGRWPRNRYEAVLRVVPQAERLLDVGCGSGLLLYNLRSRVRELYGVELARNRAEAAQQGLQVAGVPSTIVTGNIEEGLEFSDGFFDTVVWADVLPHLVNLWAAMEEVSRLLVPGGHLVTTAPNVASLRRRLMLLRGRFPATSAADEGFAVRPGALYDEGTMHYFTFSTLEKLYRKYGITPAQRLGYGRLGRLHNWWPSLVSGGICLVGVKEKPKA